jgi:uncharacterized protein YecT (DUF1311 family)
MLLALLLFVDAAPRSPTAFNCENPSPDDARPYTLCLAETDFDREEARLNRQLKITLARVRSKSGVTAERRLRHEQRLWLRNRDRKCEAVAAPTPVTQEGRNEMACRSQITADRIKYLHRVAQAR